MRSLLKVLYNFHNRYVCQLNGDLHIKGTLLFSQELDRTQGIFTFPQWLAYITISRITRTSATVTSS